MAGILRVLIIGLVLCIPIPRIWRSTRRLNWTKAILMGLYLGVVMILLLAELLSRILYYVGSRSGVWTESHPALKFLLQSKGAGQSLLADAVANGVGFLFFAVLLGLAYFWGEKQRKTGRFSRR